MSAESDLYAWGQQMIDAGIPASVIGQILSGGASTVADAQSQLSGMVMGQGGIGTPTATAAPGQINADLQQMGQQQAQQQAQQQLLAQQAAQQDAINGQFGNDMAWLDPTFQRQAAGVTPVTTQNALQYGTTADPAAAALQQQTIQGLIQRANAGPSAGEQGALDTQSAAIQQLLGVANQGATPEERAALNTESGAAGALMQRAQQGATPQELAAIGDQRQMMNSLYGDYQKGASPVELETQDDQRKGIAELMGIYQGGGQNSVAAAQRAQARASQEDWLRGQREADMQNLAERGMSGSGAELASLAQDRQAAASRLSLADLQTQADLEKSAQDALMNASGVAGQMQQGEGNIQARRLQQLMGASGAAQGITSALGNIEGRSAQELASGGGLAGNVASGYGAIQNRDLNALQGASTGASSLASNYGDIQNRAIQALLGAQSGADAMRSASDQYVSGNADRLSNAATFNANAINNASAQNKQFMQQAWQDAMTQRNNWDMQTRNLQVQVAQGLLNTDVNENQYGYGSGFDTAAADTSARNNAQSNYNANILGQFSDTAPVIYKAQAAQNQANTAGLRTGGQTIQQAGNAVLNRVTGGAYGAAQQGQQQSGPRY